MTIRSATYSLLLTVVFTAGTVYAAAKNPVDFGTGYRIDSAGMHLFLGSNFLENIRKDQITLANSRHYKEEHFKAIAQKDYERALTYCDTQIRNIENHRIRGTRFVRAYRDRALTLHALHRNAEACTAYIKAQQIQDSLMYYEQSDAVREMQTTYELDRLALDQALLRARYHRAALISLILLLLAILAVVVIIFVSNRHTKRLQRELLRKIDLARASEEQKKVFINSMCHEVRTPLNCLSGFSELLYSGDITPEIYVQYHDIIRESRRQLRYVLDDMLEVTYLENLGEPLPRAYMDLCALCRTQLRTMKVKHPEANVAFTSNIPNVELGMNTNQKYLTLLLAELLGNAYKFTPQGTIHLECGREGADKAYIRITDTGCGILPEYQEYVFERFTKLNTFSQGNGLGLYLCRLIVRHLCGEIRIVPEYTDGTRIEILFPRK